MHTYWDNFIRIYKDRLPYVNTPMLLNAFWLFCNSHDKPKNMEECDKIMGHQK